MLGKHVATNPNFKGTLKDIDEEFLEHLKVSTAVQSYPSVSYFIDDQTVTTAPSTSVEDPDPLLTAEDPDPLLTAEVLLSVVVWAIIYSLT